MNIKSYRDWFIVGTLALMLLAASPTLATFVHLPSDSAKFSELWLLGPGHKAEDYPFNVRMNVTYSVYVGVGNHLGYSAYYKIDVKFRNQTQSLLDTSNSSPSKLNSTYEFRFFLADGKIWETPLNFSFQGKPSSVRHISVNGIAFPVNLSSQWNQTLSGFYYQLFFELWLFNMTAQRFQYHNRSVGIWLNMTNGA